MWQDLLTLSRREQLGIFGLLLLLLLLLLYLFVYQSDYNSVVDEELVLWAKSVSYPADDVSKKKDTVFFFDPNIEKVSRLQMLGFSSTSIINLLKYREAGGRIKQASQLRGIYGVDSLLYRKLEKFIVIKHGQEGRSRIKIETKKDKYNLAAHFRSKPLLLSEEDISDDMQIEINSADTAMFALLYGIGPVLSRRIIAYRKKIGGYYSIEQLSEVYGVSDEVIEKNKHYLTVDITLIKPIDISKASVRQLKNHPYLNFYMAKEIYESRKRNELYSIGQFIGQEAFLRVDSMKLACYFVVGESAE
ncbi:helix-hairpin-helix domain-containing protein [Carboxylicivirga sp. M1479]|uniref:helix-hairpin-helix domain-containing protein n=1 Tax=Carboxylicivirga sp. M1479 TaxID=2594476 RepID=UPI0011789FE0|nr:helix-hairpin-helix domain-containing protein [Carboxylicivirga sp. M1479]TRX64322.1 helix-hairpin-helix domain-containing protein [Carboxylicivirga sp. M1479]